MAIGLAKVDRPIHFEITQEWLDGKADQVRRHLGSAANEMYQAGLVLQEVKEALPHGQFMSWVEANFPFHHRIANDYINVSNLLTAYIPVDQIPLLVASKSVLRELTKSTVPDTVRSELMAQLEQGQRLTVDMVVGAAQAALRSEARHEAVEAAGSPIIAEMVEVWGDGLDPEVIPVLAELEVRNPETFDEIVASGVVYDYEGEAIPLARANVRDVQSYVQHTRFERRMQGLAASGAMRIHLADERVPSQRDVYGSGKIANGALFMAAADKVKEVLEEQFPGFEQFTGPVDIVYTVEFGPRHVRGSEACIRIYEKGLVEAGLLKGDSEAYVRSHKVVARAWRPDVESSLTIDIYPRET